LINYRGAACILIILSPILFSPAYAQTSPEPKFVAIQLGYETVLVMPPNWTQSATQMTIDLKLTAQVEKVFAPDWWNTTIQHDKVNFRLVKNTDKTSKFILWTNSTQVTYNYSIIVNDTAYFGFMAPGQSENKESSRFIRWVDRKEHAASAFIPENWSAYMQIERPYQSMTRFIFFATGSDHALIYIIYPVMPLHVFPNDLLCKSVQLCSGSISADKVKDLSFGSAPLIVSDEKTPEQYFASEILPLLRKNLHSYNIVSASSAFAFTMGEENSMDTSLLPAYDLNYTFDTEGKKIDGRAMVFIRNNTAGNTGIWNGFIVGIEALDKDFDTSFQQAAVTLLTLQFDDKWLGAEKQTLLNNANSSKELRQVSELMANDTLDDFNMMISTAGHNMVRTYNDTMIAGFIDNATKQEINLPLFSKMQHWYLDGDQLIGREGARNPMKTNTLQALFL
jgi:hypothetical protein